jgi:hypothetical protein
MKKGADPNGMKLSAIGDDATVGRLCETPLPSHRDGLPIALNFMPFGADPTHREPPYRDLPPDPELTVEFAPGYSPDEPLSPDEWPDDAPLCEPTEQPCSENATSPPTRSP